MAQRTGDNPGNYAITEADQIGTGTTGERIRANMAAVRLVLDLERENRYATREEQRVLAKYVGWGGLKNVFKGDNSASKQEREAYAELKRILTPDQLFWMGQSVLDAHYTSPRVIGAMYRVLRHLGVEGGRFIEPTVGVGNFIGLMPPDMAAGARWFASEIDPVTSLIARHLYPDAQILPATGFQNAEFAYGRFDVAIGNPPFGDQRITDTNKKRADINGFKIHNYIIAKSAKHLRPGGVMGFVVTNRFLDTADPEAREYLARNFRFLGAFRLPNNAFKENAGTEVTTDIVFLQRLRDDEVATDDAWLDTNGRMSNEDGESITLNRYFAENPEMMLGKPSMLGTMYGGRGNQFTLLPREGLDVDAEIDRLVADGRIGAAGAARATNADLEVQAATVEMNREDVPIGGFFRDGDSIIQRTDDDADGNVQFRVLTADTPWTEKQALGATRLARIRGIMELRDMAYDLMAAERGDMGTDYIEGKRQLLNERYDEFVAEHGFLNDKANRALFDDDPRIEFGLEANYRKGISAAVAKKMGTTPLPPAADKSSLLIERVFFPRKEVESAENPRDGYSISLSERGRLDLEYIADLTGLSVDAVIEDLSGGDRPLIFRDPVTDKWVQEDAYLSGNVKEKLKQARGAGLDVNVRALEAVQPADVAPEDIHVEFGATWVPPEVYVDFLRLFGVRDAKVAVMPLSGSVEVQSVTGNDASPFKADIENPDYSLASLVSAVANRRKLVAYDGSADKRVVNQERTDNLSRIRRKLLAIWSDWIKADPERADKLSAVYNEVMNTTVERRYDGVTHLRTVGTNPAYSLRNSQKNSAWRMIQSSEVLLDHVVGAGKTMALTTGIMERKRLGLSKKPMVMVPNHLVGQWAREWLALYPGANILAATEKDFARSNRRRLFARIATGKFDAVIVGHSSFGHIPVSPEAEVEFIIREVEHLEQALTEAKRADSKGKGDSRQVRAIKNRIAKRTEKIKELQDKPRDNVATFEDMGIDYLAIDEFHEFKNLEYSTTLSNVAGMNSPEGSKKAFDLFMKIRLLQEAGGGVAAATGTPLSNSMVEMYTVLRYLNPGALERRNLQQFDAWVKAFASIEQRDEYTASGNLKARTVMASFNNLPELLQMYKQVADTVTMTDLKRIYADQMREENARLGTSKREEFPVPKVKTGGRRLDIGAPTPDQVEFMDYLIGRADILDKKKGKEKQEYAKTDNALWLMNDARKMSLDVRIIDPTVEDHPDNKVNRAARNIKAIYDRTQADLGTQLVFCDLSTPTKNAEKAARDFIRDAVKKLGLEKNAAVVNSLEGLNYVDKWKALETRADLMLDGGTLSDDERERVEKFLESVGDDERSALVVADSGFSVYDDLKNKLIAAGIPDNEVAFIHDANTSEQKRDLFELVNAGKVRVLVGSSMKMGAGTNAQRRLVALHHMDAPWRPSDMEQREGRIVRQGNMLYERDPDNFEVEIVAYSTERTFDAQMWGVLARKAGFLEQFRKGLRTIKEEASDADSYAEFMAEATGDQIFRDKIRLEREVDDLEAEDRSSKMKRQAAENTLSSADRRRDEYEAELAVAERYASADLSAVTFEGQTYRNDLSEVIQAAEAEYNAQMEVYREQEEQYKVARQAWEDAAGTDRGRAPAKPARPELPRLMSDRLREASEWARFIDAFTKRLELMPKDVAQHRFELTSANGVVLPVIAKWSGFRDDHIELRVTEFGSRESEQSRSDRMAGLLTPRSLMAQVRNAPIYSRRQIEGLKQAIAQAEATLQRVQPVDPAVLEKKRAEFADVKARVEAISKTMAEERAQRSNRFIERDTRRFGVAGKTVSDMRAEAAPAAIPASARFLQDKNRGAVYVEKYTDVAIAGLEDFTFFASKSENGTWGVTENSTGFNLGGNNHKTRTAAIESALSLIGRIGAEKARSSIEAAPKLSDDVKRAAIKAATDLPPVVERRGAPRASAPGVDVQGQVSVADIDAAIERFRVAQEFRQIAFHPVETVGDLPPALRAEVEKQYGEGSQPKGLMKERDGIAHVYLIAAAHDSVADVEASILHEVVGHVGMRRLFGADVTQALNKLFVSIGGVRGMMKIADARGFGERMGEYAVAIDGADMTQDVKLQVMMEEVLAHIAEDPRFMDRVKAIVGMIRQWLRDAGLAKLAEMGETDLLAMLSRGRRALNEPGVATGPAVLRVGSDAFNRWFGDSKVVDESGKPLVVYHGTQKAANGISEFGSAPGFAGQSTAGVHWFTSSASTASGYSNWANGSGNPTIYPVYIALKNPATISDYYDAAIKVGADGDPEIGLYDQALVDELKKRGFDGVMWSMAEYTGDAGFDDSNDLTVVAFRPEQIKSAVGNNGGFDPANPDIHASVSRRGGKDTPASIRRALVKRFGEAGITALESGGILRIVPTWDSLPERIRAGGEPNGRAFYDAGEGAAYLIADRLSAGTAPGVLLHEIGEHYGLRRMLGERGYTGLVSKVRAMAKNPESVARAMWDSVRNNYDEFRGREDADLAADERFLSEVVARMGEEAVFQESSLWRDIKAALQRFLLKMGLPVSLDEFDVMALVEGSLKHAMRTTSGPAPRGGMEPAFAKAKAASDAPPQASVASGLRDFMEATPTRRALSDKVADLFRTQKTFNWWNRTIGSQYHKAQKDPEFGRVFRLAQDYLDDVSRIASEAANKAGKLLPQLESVGEAFSGLRTMRRDAADAAALAGPVFHGTLMDKVWTDDELMNPPVDPLSRAPLFEALTPEQIELYREFRAAVDKSLDDLAVSEMARLAKASKMEVAPVDMTLAQTAQFYYEQFGGRLETLEIERAELVRTHNGERKLLEEAATDLPEGSAGRRAYLDQVDEMRARQRAELKALDQELAGLEVLRTGFLDKAAKISQLKAKGYAPLMRFGQYTVDVFLQKTDSAGNPMLDDKGEPEVVRDNDGEPIRPFFGMFESEREANEAARMLQEEYPDYTIRQGVLSQNAYELFKGVTPETVELFGQMIGAENEAAFQSYLKLAVSNRSAMKRLIERKGMAGFAQDPSRVLAAFILSNARAAAGNWHFGDMMKAAAAIPKTKGDVKDEAVKLMSYVQNPQEEASVIRGILFAQHLGGSVASALVNMTQSFTTTYPYLHQFGEGAAAAVGEGMRMAAKLSVRRDANVTDPALREALDRATEEGIVSPHEIHLLMGQANPTSAFGSNRLMRNVMRLWGSFYSLAERYNRHAAFIAGWKMAMQRGMAPDAAYEFAKQTVTETQFVYSKANKPNWARGAVGATLFTFKTFLINYVEFLKRLPAKERALALAVLLMAAGLSGMPGADDLDDLIDTVGQALGFATNTKQAKQEFAARWLGKDAAGFLLHGVSYGLPLDLSSRLGVGNLVPGTAIFKKSEQDKSGEVMEAVGPAAGLAQSFARAFEGVTSGEVVRGGAELLPKAFKDAFKAKEMYQTGLYKDFRGRTVTDVDAIDAMVKAIGFQPTDVAEVQRARVRMRDTVNLVKTIESDIAEKWARGLSEGDRKAVAAAREELQTWNQRNPEAPIRISFSQIQRRVNEMKRTAADRLINATPRELRAMVREGVSQ